MTKAKNEFNKQYLKFVTLLLIFTSGLILTNSSINVFFLINTKVMTKNPLKICIALHFNFFKTVFLSLVGLDLDAFQLGWNSNCHMHAR